MQTHEIGLNTSTSTLLQKFCMQQLMKFDLMNTFPNLNVKNVRNSCGHSNHDTTDRSLKKKQQQR